MARSAEKAMTALARWRAAYVEHKRMPEVRSNDPSSVSDVRKADRYRRQIITEISRRVAQIQNAGLGEYKIRDINDEINKLLREKARWEDRILELGGADYKKLAPKMLDSDGREVPGVRGYMYFGAAKKLPGVSDLFGQEPTAVPRKTRSELLHGIDAEYYGYLDDDDGVLMPLELEAEQNARQKLIAEWQEKYGEKGSRPTMPDNAISNGHAGDDDGALTIDNLRMIAHVPLPTRADIETAIVERRKAELMSLYGIDDDVEMAGDGL